MLKRKIVALEDAEDDDFIVSLWSAELHSEAADICCFSTECGHGRSSAGRAVARFSHTLAMGLSSSVVVVGPRGDERDRLVQAMARAGSAGDREGLEKAKSEAPAAVAGYALPRVGIVDGLLTNSDHEAVVSLANQFMMRSSREKKFVTALEDLEDFFRQCRLEGRPAVVVVEELQEFVRREKQILIYTLLDLMHRSDLLFTFIGVTDYCAVHTLLEKRVLSRLNAQYIYLDPPTASSICWELHQLLTKPIQHFLQQKEEKESVSSTEEIALRQRRTQYCREVLRRICYLFGEFCIVDSSDKLEPSGIHDDDAFETGTDQGTALPYRQLHLGVLHELIDQLVFLGNAIRYFRRIISYLLISYHTIEGPLLSAYSFCMTVRCQQPPSIADRLNQLCSVDLHLFISLLRMHLRRVNAVNSFEAQDVPNSDGGSGIRAVEVLAEFDKLTNMIKKEKVPMKKLWTGLQNLVTLKLIFSDNSDAGKQTHAETRQCHYLGYVDGRMVDEHSVLYLQVSAVEAQDSFRLKVASDVGNDFLTSDSEQKLFSHWSDSTEEQKEALRNAIARRVLATFQRETQVLHVKEGLRQAVLRPHEPFYANQLV